MSNSNSKKCAVDRIRVNRTVKKIRIRDRLRFQRRKVYERTQRVI